VSHRRGRLRLALGHGDVRLTWRSWVDTMRRF
jgi:hypothetical protein